MDTQSLPIMPFGKYKGKPITEFLADKNYVEWCKNQPGMLEKNPTIYNIVVTQQITPNNQTSKTPEHNKLQNLFLNPENLYNLRKHIFKNLNGFENNLNNLINDEDFIRYFGKHDIKDLMINRIKGSVKFEDKYNWDISHSLEKYITFEPIVDCVKNKKDYRKDYDIKEKEEYKNRLLLIDELLSELKKKCEKFIKNFDSYFDFCGYGDIKDMKKDYEYYYIKEYEEIFNKCYDEYKTKYNNDKKKCYKDIMNKYGLTNHEIDMDVNQIELEMDLYYNNIYCELKPTLGDEYPGVLRKMRTQISLTNNNNNDKSLCYRYRTKNMYVLIIGSFESIAASKKELIEIFNPDIRVLFVNDIIPSSCVGQFPSGKQILANQQVKDKDEELALQQELDKYKKIEEQNKKLIENELYLQQKLTQTEDKLAQTEDKYKKIQEELLLLKNPSKSKKINDYFGKKSFMTA